MLAEFKAAARIARMSFWQLASDVVFRLFRRFETIGASIHRRRGRYLVVAFPMLWLGLFFLAPLLIVLKISFAEPQVAQPPYTPLIQLPLEGEYKTTLTLSTEGYALIKDDELYRDAFLNSLKTAAISTFLALIIGFPMAYAIARADPKLRLVLLMLVVLPFWTSSLLRTYAWLGMLKDSGVINNVLISIGLIKEPLRILNTNSAVYLGIVYGYLPFMVLPLVATLVKMDLTLLEAAADLGCRPLKAFINITLPLALPGIIAGSMLVFIPTLGEFVIPDILGGVDNLMIGRVLWNEFFTNTQWPLASAIAITMLVLIVLPLLIFEYVQNTYFADKRRT
jgi:putrescine transport system permease protein